MTFKPKPYQVECTEAVCKDYFSGNNRLLVQKATGLGKTVWMTMVPDAIKLHSAQRGLIAVHREELVWQTVDKFSKFAPHLSVGVEMAEHQAGKEQIVVASIQTIGRSGSDRIKKFDPNKFGLIMTDEAHHALASSYLNVYNHFGVDTRPDILHVGLTATAKRSDGKGLHKVFQKISYQYGIKDAVKDGWLVPPRGRRVNTQTDIDGVNVTSSGDFNEHDLSGAIDNPKRNKLAVKAYQEYALGRRFVAFCVDIQHSKNLAAAFRAEGLAVEAVWGDDPDRARKLADHKAGKLVGLCNAQVLTEGYDDWQISCIIMARPTKSESLYTQIVGRGIRLPADVWNLLEAITSGVELPKTDCLVLDLVDVTKHHSLATLPSLFGLNPKADMNGKTVVEVLEEIEAAKAENPFIDYTKAESLADIKLWAESVDLFKNAEPPEVIQISEYRWVRIEDFYALMLRNNQHVMVFQDLLGQWYAKGEVGSVTVNRGPIKSFEEAIKNADYDVKMWGGKQRQSAAKRIFKSHDDPPSKADIWVAEGLGIKVLPGITKGKLHDLISVERAKQLKVG